MKINVCDTKWTVRSGRTVKEGSDLGVSERGLILATSC